MHALGLDVLGAHPRRLPSWRTIVGLGLLKVVVLGVFL